MLPSRTSIVTFVLHFVGFRSFPATLGKGSFWAITHVLFLSTSKLAQGGVLPKCAQVQGLHKRLTL